MNKEIGQKPVAVFDIDGTVYRSNFLIDIVDNLVDIGIFAGKARPGHHNKNETLLTKLEEHNLTLTGSIGVGDTESDIPMLALVERPIAFNPNKELLEHALSQGWEVVSEHKDTIYHISGGRYEERDNFGRFYS